MSLYEDLKDVINKNNVDGLLNTPDFIIAQFLMEVIVGMERLNQNKIGYSKQDINQYVEQCINNENKV